MEEYDIRTKWRVKCLGMELPFSSNLMFGHSESEMDVA